MPRFLAHLLSSFPAFFLHCAVNPGKAFTFPVEYLFSERREARWETPNNMRLCQKPRNIKIGVITNLWWTSSSRLGCGLVLGMCLLWTFGWTSSWRLGRNLLLGMCLLWTFGWTSSWRLGCGPALGMCLLRTFRWRSSWRQGRSLLLVRRPGARNLPAVDVWVDV